MVITSRSNPAVVAAAALKEKKYRDASSLFMLEGEKLFLEAVSSGIGISEVFVTEGKLSLCRGKVSDELIRVVSDGVIEKISTEKSPQGIICVAKYIDKIHIINKIYNMEDFSDGRRIMILSSIRDPGNLGTIIRTASAFGVDELILSSDCADIYNPRTVRAAMGTLFRQRVSYVSDLPATVTELNLAGYDTRAAMLDDGSERLDCMRINRKTAFIVGNEGHGIAPEVVSSASGRVYIPMVNGVESLNAASAATVFLWSGMTRSED